MWHMACSCYYDGCQTDVLLYGGNKHRQSGSERHVMTGLTIFTHGKYVYSIAHCVSIVCGQLVFFFFPVVTHIPYRMLFIGQ